MHGSSSADITTARPHGPPAALRDPGPAVVLRPAGFAARPVRWGRCWQIGTAAYWVAVTAAAVDDGRLAGDPARHRLGETLAEEIAPCLLGGHGMPHQAGLAAFETLRARRLLAGPADAQILEQALRQPMAAAGRIIRYRRAGPGRRGNTPGRAGRPAGLASRPARHRLEDRQLDRAQPPRQR